MRPHSINYQSTGVSYDILDSFKRLCQQKAKKTAKANSIIHEVSESRGESSFVFEEKDCYRAFVIEGLGTKSLIADAFGRITGKSYFRDIAKDTVAAIVNDLIVVGATPEIVNAYFASGNSNWFSDKKRIHDLARGWADACIEAGAIWGGGETPVLKGIIQDSSIDLAGSAIGIIKPKKRLQSANRLRHGDAIVCIESNGIHANGLTLARKIASVLPHGFKTLLPDGEMYGEALLRPSHIYTATVEDLFAGNIDLHYMVHITGHGWRKIMRADKPFTYEIDTICKPPVLFDFIQKQSGCSDSEMYAVFNMGAGFAVFIPENNVKKAVDIISRHRLHAWKAGTVKKGPRRVILASKGITYKAKSLQLR